mgnify:FL=1
MKQYSDIEQMKSFLKEGERLDDLERNSYFIIQNPEKFCFGMDAVLLSGFASVKPEEKVLDLGTGTGIIPILLEAKTEASHLTGLEIQYESVDMARRSIVLNHLEDKIDIVEGDIKTASSIFPKASFQVVTTNPPYMTDLHGIKNPQAPKAIARHEVLCTLTDVVREASLLMEPGGRLYMVHRPFRLAEIFRALSAFKLEPKRMRFVHSFIDREPTMVLIEAVRGGKARLQVEPPLVIFESLGIYTEEIKEKYGF